MHVWFTLRGWDRWLWGSVGLLMQQMGMFSFGCTEFHRDLRHGCSQNNVKRRNVKQNPSASMRAVGVSHLISGVFVEHTVARQLHLYPQSCGGFWIRWGSVLVACQAFSEPVSLTWEETISGEGLKTMKLELLKNSEDKIGINASKQQHHPGS